MKNLANRSARFTLVVPLTFKIGDLFIEGHSVNVSESGLLASFGRPVEIWDTGEISMVVGEYIVAIEARAARILDDYVGLSFLIESENDQLAVNIINDYAITLKQEYVSGERPALEARRAAASKNERGRR